MNRPFKRTALFEKEVFCNTRKVFTDHVKQSQYCILINFEWYCTCFFVFHKPRINVIISKLQHFTYMLLTYYCSRVCAEYSVIIL